MMASQKSLSAPFPRINHYRNLCLFVITFGAILMMISCNSKVSSIPPDLLSNKRPPSIEATDFQTFFTDSGVIRYSLTTPKLLIFSKEKEPYKEFPDGFRLQQFNAKKQIISEMSANYGKNFERQQRWLATGNVVMINNKGDTLRTEELNYLVQEDKIYTDKFFSLKKGDQFLSGTGGFESDTQMKKYTFKQTKGYTYVEEK